MSLSRFPLDKSWASHVTIYFGPSCFQDILRQSSVQVHIEVRPKYLIPDTNCFIDFCTTLITLAETYPLFQLLVPLVGESNNPLFHTVSYTDLFNHLILFSGE